MAKSKRRASKQRTEKTTKRRRKSDNVSGQTNQPFEQDSKRRIGQYEGEGEPSVKNRIPRYGSNQIIVQ